MMLDVALAVQAVQNRWCSTRIAPSASPSPHPCVRVDRQGTADESQTSPRQGIPCSQLACSQVTSGVLTHLAELQTRLLYLSSLLGVGIGGPDHRVGAFEQCDAGFDANSPRPHPREPMSHFRQNDAARQPCPSGSSQYLLFGSGPCRRRRALGRLAHGHARSTISVNC